MYISSTMEQVIKQLAATHAIDVTKPEAYLKLCLEGYLPLVIHTVEAHCVSVMHMTHEQLADPEIVFWTGYAEGWMPLAVTQLVGGHRAYGCLDESGTQLLWLDTSRQASLNHFAEIWAQNILAQGWVAYGEKTPDRFPLGRIVATPGALSALVMADVAPKALLERHSCGDWGELETFDRQQNERALRYGGRLVSRYGLGNRLILWLITEADRSVTTLLTPAEY